MRNVIENGTRVRIEAGARVWSMSGTLLSAAGRETSKRIFRELGKTKKALASLVVGVVPAQRGRPMVYLVRKPDLVVVAVDAALCTALEVG